MNYFKRLIFFAKPYFRYLLVISVLILVMSGLRQVEPMVFKRITDTVATSNGEVPQNIITLLAIFLIVKIFGTILNRTSWYFANIFSYKLRFNLRERGYEHLLALPISFFNSQQSGKLMNQLERGATQITQIVNNSGMFFVPNVITAIIGLVIMGSYNLKVALLVLIVFVPVGLINYWKFIKNQGLEKQENKLYDNQYGHFWETISAIELVKSFVAESFEIRQFRNFHNQILEIRKKIEKNHNVFTLSDIFLESWIWGIYSYIIYLAFLGEFGLGTMVLMISYIGIIREPLWSLNWIFWEAKRAQIGAKEYFEILDAKSDILDPSNPVKVNKLSGNIKFDKVSFKYKNGSTVFKQVSFEIKKGQTCALVGKSGAGKTTVAGLLNRYFDIDSGMISIDGIDIRNLRLKDLRRNIATVTQEAYLFADSIIENLKYGNPKAKFEEMVNACKIASADEFIVKLENGYDSEIGERGTKLSGGQKQRLSMARAILKDPSILILDEATSQLDSESESLIQKALVNVIKDRTTIVIAHRLSTIKKADKIIVFDKGKILEEGNHNELMKNGKLYASLFNLQSGQKDILEEWEIVS